MELPYLSWIGDDYHLLATLSSPSNSRLAVEPLQDSYDERGHLPAAIP